MDALTRRQQTQEKELQRSSQHVENAMAMAGEETAKSRAAKEVIKSLTAQVWHTLPLISSLFVTVLRLAILPIFVQLLNHTTFTKQCYYYVW